MTWQVKEKVASRVERAVLLAARQHEDYWCDKDDDYWLQRLMQEVGELASVLAGDHPDTVEHELLQVASIAVNWLKKRGGYADGRPHRK